MSQPPGTDTGTPADCYFHDFIGILVGKLGFTVQVTLPHFD